MADPFIHQLIELCQQRPVLPKWVFVANQGRRWNLAERLLQENCNWVNLRLVTPFQMALEAVAPDLVARGIHPCPESLGPSLIQALMRRADMTTGHFSEVLEFPGTAEAVWRTLCQYRLAGLDSTALDKLPPGPKRAQLGQLFSAYEHYLVQERLADRADILRTAPRRLPIHNDDPVLIDPAVYYGHREMDLAMSELFGGFSSRFYDAYHAAYPIDPGYEERRALYQLYYLLVHLNLFGESYGGRVDAIAARYAGRG